jgi:rfaE bifunctional protein nucleotidyltransferase chain/domain
MTSEKILSLDEAIARVSAWKSTGEKIVFTNGCFDILHVGHADYLEKAALLGTKLVVGLNTDESVKRLKGESRPVNPEYARARLLAALGFVDLVVLFAEDTPLDLIKALLPSVLVKGNDYSADNIVGAKEVIASGGSVETLPLVAGFSTTAIIEKAAKK